ncbi:MAG: site-2 protease family protein [Oscillospiraceae bacterium]|jgi:regulator of sigma E protease|nr:site-2 protease family protein [Oscillospiraceae bacterium]
MLYILIASLMFGILIALHEFGHFAAAKLCGVKVNEFAIGMGPLVLHRQGKETEYSLRLFPIGGFCAMEGEEEGKSLDPRAFPNRPWWQRMIILLAGVFMNFLTGLIIILVLLAPAEGFRTAVISGFSTDVTVQAQGVLQAGDRIIRVDGHAVYLQPDVSFFLSRITGSQVDLEVEREGKKLSLPGVPLTAVTQPDGSERLMLGIYMQEFEKATLLAKLRYTWLEAADNVRMVWYSLSELLRGAVGLRDMSGPVGIIDMVGQVGQAGASAAEAAGSSAFLGALQGILSFTSFISINLAVMNLLPIPALDGGQIFFMGVNGVYTAFTKKKMDPKYLGWVSAAGFVCLMALMLAVTISDILKKFGV